MSPDVIILHKPLSNAPGIAATAWHLSGNDAVLDIGRLSSGLGANTAFLYRQEDRMVGRLLSGATGLAAAAPALPPARQKYGCDDNFDFSLSSEALAQQHFPDCKILYLGGEGLIDLALVQSVARRRRQGSGPQLRLLLDLRSLLFMQQLQQLKQLEYLLALADFIEIPEANLEHVFVRVGRYHALTKLRNMARHAAILVSRQHEDSVLFTSRQMHTLPQTGMHGAGSMGGEDVLMGSWMASHCLHPGFGGGQHIDFAMHCASALARRPQLDGLLLQQWRQHGRQAVTAA